MRKVYPPHNDYHRSNKNIPTYLLPSPECSTSTVVEQKQANDLIVRTEFYVRAIQHQHIQNRSSCIFTLCGENPSLVGYHALNTSACLLSPFVCGYHFKFSGLGFNLVWLSILLEVPAAYQMKSIFPCSRTSCLRSRSCKLGSTYRTLPPSIPATFISRTVTRHRANP